MGVKPPILRFTIDYTIAVVVAAAEEAAAGVYGVMSMTTFLQALLGAIIRNKVPSQIYNFR